jgi:hypothetical protein
MKLWRSCFLQPWHETDTGINHDWATNIESDTSWFFWKLGSHPNNGENRIYEVIKKKLTGIVTSWHWFSGALVVCNTQYHRMGLPRILPCWICSQNIRGSSCLLLRQLVYYPLTQLNPSLAGSHSKAMHFLLFISRPSFHSMFFLSYRWRLNSDNLSFGVGICLMYWSLHLVWSTRRPAVALECRRVKSSLWDAGFTLYATFLTAKKKIRTETKWKCFRFNFNIELSNDLVTCAGHPSLQSCQGFPHTQGCSPQSAPDAHLQHHRRLLPPPSCCGVVCNLIMQGGWC